MSRHDETPAFPGVWENDGDQLATAPDGQLVPPDGVVYMKGMALRDFFAAKALAAFIGNGPSSDYIDVPKTCKAAYQVADAMLEARRA